MQNEVCELTFFVLIFLVAVQIYLVMNYLFKLIHPRKKKLYYYFLVSFIRSLSSCLVFFSSSVSKAEHDISMFCPL